MLFVLISTLITRIASEGWNLRQTVEEVHTKATLRHVAALANDNDKRQYRDDVGKQTFEKAAADLLGLPSTFNMPLAPQPQGVKVAEGLLETDIQGIPHLSMYLLCGTLAIYLVMTHLITGWRLLTNICFDEDGVATEYRNPLHAGGAQPNEGDLAFKYADSKFPNLRQVCSLIPLFYFIVFGEKLMWFHSFSPCAPRFLVLGRK
jgi:hypothetical protein